MSTIQDFQFSIKEAIESENWIAALTLSLTLPDICCYCSTGAKVKSKDYAAWFDKWVSPKYTFGTGPESQQMVFLCGDDAYALRCALLHQGGDDIADQRMRKVITHFVFCSTGKGDDQVVHCNRVGDALQLQVDIFARDLVNGCSDWLRSVQSNPAVLDRCSSLLGITQLDAAEGFSF